MSTPSVLIVDDDENLRYSLAMILQKEGYRVRTAGCGHLAMEMMDTWHFDLLLLDLNLADVHEHDIISEIQKRQPATPVLVLTATPAHDAELEAQRLQVMGYLMKPIEPEILLGRVRKALAPEY